MQHIRILLASSMPGLRSMVERAVAGQDDLWLITGREDPVATLLRAGQIEADVVIVAMKVGELPAIAERLADEYPWMPVLAVDPARKVAVTLAARPAPRELTAVTADGLLAAIRAAAPRPVER